MRNLIIIVTALSTAYVLWSCKVRLAENSTVAASESELAKSRGVDCKPVSGDYPKLSGVTVDPDHAALGFTLEDRSASGSTFRLRYFTHATKYYDPAQDMQFYAVRLGDNLLDFEASDSTVKKIYYKPAGQAVELSCK